MSQTRPDQSLQLTLDPAAGLAVAELTSASNAAEQLGKAPLRPSDGNSMTFQPDSHAIHWRVHFRNRRERVFEALATDAGRASFWAESAPEANGRITFNFLNHASVIGRIIDSKPPSFFAVEYFGAVVEFSLEDDGSGGTDLTLVSTGVPETSRVEVIAGWVSVLMAMKAAVDFGVDLRNHDESRSWSDGYVEN